MNAPANKQDDGGISLVTILGAGAILAVVALVMMSGDGDTKVKPKKVTEEVAAAEAKRKASTRSGISARKVDDANAAGRDPNSPPPSAAEVAKANQDQLEARGHTIAAPPAFDTKEEEKAWWTERLEIASGLKARREEALALIIDQEALIETAKNPQKSRKLWVKKKDRATRQVQQSTEEVRQIEERMPQP
jgi:hypothetical protein